MVAPLIKALGALVVGTPVAVALGLTARSLRKQEDASVPVIGGQESPLVVSVFSNYLDKRTHEYLAPTSFKKGYVVYDIRVENRTDHVVKGVHVELISGTEDVSGHVRLGDVAPRGTSVFSAKKPWNAAFEHYRSTETDEPRVVLTWKSTVGRRRVISPVTIRRVLGETPSEQRRRRRAKAPVVARVMS